MNTIIIREETESEADRRITSWDREDSKHSGRFGTLRWEDYLKELGSEIERESREKCEIVVAEIDNTTKIALRYTDFTPEFKKEADIEEECNKERRKMFPKKIVPRSKVSVSKKNRNYIREIIDYQRSSA